MNLSTSFREVPSRVDFREVLSCVDKHQSFLCTYNLKVISFSNELEQIHLYTNISIVSVQLNGFSYCYLTLIISISIICLQIVKWLQVLLFNTNYSIQHYSFTCIQLNGSKYCYVIPIIQFRHTDIEFPILLFKTNYSIQHYSFVCAQLNGSKYASITIQFSIGHLFPHNLNLKSFYLTHR